MIKINFSIAGISTGIIYSEKKKEGAARHRSKQLKKKQNSTKQDKQRKIKR